METRFNDMEQQSNSSSSNLNTPEYQLLNTDDLGSQPLEELGLINSVENLPKNSQKITESPIEEPFSTIDSTYYSSIETPETDSSLDYKLNNTTIFNEDDKAEDFFDDTSSISLIDSKTPPHVEEIDVDDFDDINDIYKTNNQSESSLDDTSAISSFSDQLAKNELEPNLDFEPSINDLEETDPLDIEDDLDDSDLKEMIPDDFNDAPPIDNPSQEQNDSFFGDLSTIDSPSNNIEDSIDITDLDDLEETDPLDIEDDLDDSDLKEMIPDDFNDAPPIDNPSQEQNDSFFGDLSTIDSPSNNIEDSIDITDLDDLEETDPLDIEDDLDDSDLKEMIPDDFNDAPPIDNPSQEQNDSFFGDLSTIDSPSNNIEDSIDITDLDDLEETDPLDIEDDLDLPTLEKDILQETDFNEQLTENEPEPDLDLDPLESSMDDLDLPTLEKDILQETDFNEQLTENEPEPDLDLDPLDIEDDLDLPTLEKDILQETDFNEQLTENEPEPDLDLDPLESSMDDLDLDPLESSMDDFGLEENIEFNPDGTPKNTSIKDETLYTNRQSLSQVSAEEYDGIEFNPDGTPRNVKVPRTTNYQSGNSNQSFSDLYENDATGVPLDLEGLEEKEAGDPFNISDDLDIPEMGDSSFQSDYDDQFQLDDLGSDDNYQPMDDYEGENSFSSSPSPQQPFVSNTRDEVKISKIKPKSSEPKLSGPKKVVLVLGILFFSFVGFYTYIFSDGDAELKKGLIKIDQYDYETANSIFDSENPSVGWYNKYALAFMKQGNYRFAKDKLLGREDDGGGKISQGAIDIAPRDKETLMNIANLFVMEKQFDKAFATSPGENGSFPVTLRYLEEKYSNDYKVQDTIAQAYIEWGKYLDIPSEKKQKFDSASAIYHNELRTNPKNIAPFSRLLEISLLTNDRLEERLNQMKIRGLDKYIDTLTLAKIGQYYLNREQITSATQIFNLLTQRNDNDHAIVFETIGKYYAVAQDFKKAEENLIKGIYSNSILDENKNFVKPKDSILHARINNELGQVYVHYSGQYQGTAPTDLKQKDRFKSLARYHYNEAKRYDKENPYTYYLSGNLQYAIEKNYSNAILDLEKSYSLLRQKEMPIPSDLAYNLGNALYKKENYNRALDILSELRVKTQLQYPSLEYLMGMTYMKLGVNSEAVVKLNHTLEYLNDTTHYAKTIGMPRTLNQNQSLYLASITKNNIGAIYQKEGNIKNSGELKNQARSYFYQALEDSSHINPQFKMAYPSLNLQDNLLEDNLTFAQNFSIQGRDPLVYEYSPEFIGDYL